MSSIVNKHKITAFSDSSMGQTPNKLTLTVQYISKLPEVPNRHQFRKWVKAALTESAEIVVRIVDQEEGQSLNQRFRGKPYPTNVLTFTYDDSLPLAGDIVLCAPVVISEAQEQHKRIEAHYAHLTIHGVLHLQGYDHETESEAEIMEQIESRLMIQLGYPNPYS